MSNHHLWNMYGIYGCFQKIGVPQNGWFIMENPIKMDELGGPPLFLKTSIYSATLHLCILSSTSLSDIEIRSLASGCPRTSGALQRRKFTAKTCILGGCDKGTCRKSWIYLITFDGVKQLGSLGNSAHTYSCWRLHSATSGSPPQNPPKISGLGFHIVSPGDSLNFWCQNYSAIN